MDGGLPYVSWDIQTISPMASNDVAYQELEIQNQRIDKQGINASIFAEEGGNSEDLLE